MATDTKEYVKDNGDDGIQIMDDGFITPENISLMKFTFSKPQDITESLQKKNSGSRDQISVTKNGRTAYSSLTCHYPNKKDTSSKVMLTDCVVQYREGIDREDSKYGRGYVTIGIPTIYINKMKTDAKANSSVNATVKEKVKAQEGCYWLDCTLDKLSETNTWLLYTKDGEEVGANSSIQAILSGLKHSLVVDAMFTCSVSSATDTMNEIIDVDNGTFTFTMKPTEMYLKDTYNKIGPVLDDTTRRKKEGANQSMRLLASNKLAELAMRNLNI